MKLRLENLETQEETFMKKWSYFLMNIGFTPLDLAQLESITEKTGKKLAIFTANLKIKYYDDSFKDKFEIISHKAEDRKFGKSEIVAIHKLEEVGGKLNQFIAKGLNKAKKDFGLQSEELPGAIQIVYNGAQVMNWGKNICSKVFC